MAKWYAGSNRGHPTGDQRPSLNESKGYVLIASEPLIKKSTPQTQPRSGIQSSNLHRPAEIQRLMGVFPAGPLSAAAAITGLRKIATPAHSFILTGSTRRGRIGKWHGWVLTGHRAVVDPNHQMKRLRDDDVLWQLIPNSPLILCASDRHPWIFDGPTIPRR